MGEKMTLEQVRDKLRMCSTLGNMCDGLIGQCADAIDAHLTQPSQAVDVEAGSAHRGECPVKMARAVCNAIIKHQFQDEHRKGRLTLDVETFLHEFNAARDAGLTAALPNANGKEG